MKLNNDCISVIIEHLEKNDLMKWRSVNKIIRELSIKEINKRGYLMSIKLDSLEKINEVLKLYKHLNLNGRQIGTVIILPSVQNVYTCQNMSTITSLHINYGQIDCSLLPLLTKLSISHALTLNLTALTNLTELEIEDNDLSNSEIEHFTNLTTLNLSCTDITDNCIKKFKKLEHLSYDGELDFYKLSKLTNLKTLSLSGVYINELEILPRFKKLKSLKLRECKLIDGIFTEISNLPSLDSLTYMTVSYDNHHIDEIKLLKNIKSLNLCGCWGLTDDVLISILENNDIKYIILSNCESLTDAVIPYLTKKGTKTYWDSKSILDESVICHKF